MTSKLTREDLLNIIETDHVQCGEASALSRMVLGAMESEPVAWTWHYREKWHVTNDEERARDLAWDGVKIEPLYRHAQPGPERDQVRREHAEWSQATFGNVGPVGPLKHLSKEALEAAAEPGDLSEWADMQFLLWDAQRRAGITDDQITQAMIDKLAVNKQREWPEPKDGEPRLHIKSQPATQEVHDEK
ncbi:Eaa1 [Klebsiella quasipneumoniae]|nr:Eaa1 [Klebsiella quasipneumoniae]